MLYLPPSAFIPIHPHSSPGMAASSPAIGQAVGRKLPPRPLISTFISLHHFQSVTMCIRAQRRTAAVSMFLCSRLGRSPPPNRPILPIGVGSRLRCRRFSDPLPARQRVAPQKHQTRHRCRASQGLNSHCSCFRAFSRTRDYKTILHHIFALSTTFATQPVL
jgi:hypothetical protein